MKNALYKSFAAVALAFVTGVAGVTPRVEAMVVPSQVASEAVAMDRAADWQVVQTALENKLVRERLNSYGLTDSEINTRLERLSDQQLHQVALNISQQNPAGDDDDDDLVIGLLVGVILVALIVWLVQALD